MSPPTPQQQQQTADSVSYGETTNCSVKQSGEGLYHYEGKKLYSCPAKCGYEGDDKNYMHKYLWANHRSEGLSLMRQLQISSGSKFIEPYPCYGCSLQPTFRPRLLIKHFRTAHSAEAEDYVSRLKTQITDEINPGALTTQQVYSRAKSLQKQKRGAVTKAAQDKQKLKQAADCEKFMLEQQQALFSAHAAARAPAAQLFASFTPIDTTQQRREPRSNLCRIKGCSESFRTHKDLEAHMNNPDHPRG